jgi:hypothetical protein
MKTLGLVAVCTLTILSAPAVLRAQSGANPNQPFIESISYGGTGCPQGSVGSSMANDRLSFTLIFDSFVASTGVNTPATEARKNCQLNVNVHVPNGSGQYCAAVGYRGYVQLPAGVTATQGAEYNGIAPEQGYELPDGQVITIGDEHSDFTGPVAKDYLSRDEVNLAWDGAEAAVNPLTVAAFVRINQIGSSAQITTDSIDGRISFGACGATEDTTAPDITISSPITNGLYGLGAAVTPVFSCQDGQSGVASCTGAAALDTSSIGPKTFTVTAVDAAGNTSTASVSYAVGGKDECKSSGYGRFLAPTFTNQGQCVSTYAGKK